MKKVRYIPPKPKEYKKLKVAAYCRVSTLSPAQRHSLGCSDPKQLKRCFKMRSMSAMPCFKRPIPLIFLKRSELSITKLCLSIMWKTATRQSSQGIYICRCKKRSQGEQISATPRVAVNEFIAQGMHYQALSFAVSAGRYFTDNSGGSFANRSY